MTASSVSIVDLEQVNVSWWPIRKHLFKVRYKGNYWFHSLCSKSKIMIPLIKKLTLNKLNYVFLLLTMSIS